MAQGVKGTGGAAEAQRRYRERHGPEVIAAKEKNRHLISSYGINSDDYESMFQKQNKKCAICQRKTTLVVDHDHETGKVRGLLCRTCNSAIDLLDIRAAEDYLLGSKPLQIIGITGLLRTGKDSVAALLQNFGYTKIAFADPLRELAIAINPHISLDNTPEDIITDITKTTGSRVSVLYADLLDIVGYERAKTVPDFRRFLQKLGTEGVRNILGQDTWIRLLRKRLEPHKSYVVSDCRFQNEADMIRHLGGTIWRTERPGYGSTSNHASETLEVKPDVILRASSLLDNGDEVGLGTLVLQEIGRETETSILNSWATNQNASLMKEIVSD